MKSIISSLLFIFCLSLTNGQLNMTYQGNITYSETLSDIWGYVAPDGTEYALVGVANGVSIVDLTDPENPTEVWFVNGINSFWRDIVTYDQFAYVSNESGEGLMIIDLSGLPNSVQSTNWTPTIPGFAPGTLNTIHNLWIDEFGYLYLLGSNLNQGGMIYVDVFTNPSIPQYVGHGPPVYNHDAYVRDNIAYSCEIYEGQFAVYDVSNKSNTVLLGSQETDFAFTHNAWLSDDGNILYTTDEVASAPVGAYDVSDPTDIIELDLFKPYATLGDGVIPHNVHVWDDWLIISYYTDGCILVDGSNPDNLVEVGNFDTYIPTGTGFNGAWGAYPYLPSGLVLVSDIGNGMYVLEPNYVNACWLEGNVIDASTLDGISGAEIEITSTNVVDESQTDGSYATGYAVAGTYTVNVSSPGYESATVDVDLLNGVITMQDFELVPLIPFAFTGSVVEAGTGTPIPEAKVTIFNDGFDFDITCDASGNFLLNTFFAGDYEVFAGKWGYKTYGDEDAAFDELTNNILIELEPGYEDIFSVDLGWDTEFDAFQGAWEFGAPIGQIPDGAPSYIAPPMDVADDLGNSCYVTGNDPSLFEGILAGGNARLISPVFEIGDYQWPKMSFYTWWFNINQATGETGEIYMYVTLSNGSQSVVIDTLDYPELDVVNWEYHEYFIPDFIQPNDSMKITFEAESSPDFYWLSEAGVDHFRVWDAATTSLDESELILGNMLAYPNPSNNTYSIKYSLIERNQNARIEIINSIGQIVSRINIQDQNGLIEFGSELNAGIYFARLFNDDQVIKSLKLIKQ